MNTKFNFGDTVDAIDLDVEGVIVGIQGVQQPSGTIRITYLIHCDVDGQVEDHIVHEGAIRDVAGVA